MSLSRTAVSLVNGDEVPTFVIETSNEWLLESGRDERSMFFDHSSPSHIVEPYEVPFIFTSTVLFSLLQEPDKSKLV